MFGQLYSHDELTKYIAIFGTLFNDVVISRDDDTGKQVQKLKVPIQYGPREKALARTDSDPNLDRPYAELLPRMSFEMVNIDYDAERKRSTSQRWATKTTTPDGKKISYSAMYMPVPYDITFQLSILANRAKDACRIVQSILPYFRPDLTVAANIVDELPDYVIDIPVIRTGITMEDSYEGPYPDRRIIEWKLTFVMKVEIFGPVTEAKIIKFAKVNLYADKEPGQDNLQPDEIIQIQPGLTANGQPTSNAALSIPVAQIEATDNWGYVIQITDNTIR